MRLLRLDEDDNIRYKEFVGDEIPPYGILSHTWGSTDEEISLKDLQHGDANTKPGYVKLQFCAARVAADGLQWFWVDTCSIDKTSSAELSEAINSMYRWYRLATKCYVYLSDVTFGHNQDNETSKQIEPVLTESFSESKWFTRGWTLQELLAPANVEFFTVDGVRIGDKRALGSQIETITGVPQSALYGGSLFEISVEQRLSWAKGRKTTREEDMAYCLLGIFDITMPLLYGEGKQKAMTRLYREIKESLPDVQQAGLHNAMQTLNFKKSASSQQGEETVEQPVIHRAVSILDNCPIAAACPEKDIIDVIVFGDDSTLKHMRLSTAGPASVKWQSDGKWFSDVPLMLSSRRSQLDIIAPNPYGQPLYQSTQTGLLLRELWGALGGTINSPLTGVSLSSNHSAFFGLDSNGAVVQKSLVNGRWLPSKESWADLGGPFALPPHAVASPAGHIHVFVTTGYSSRLYCKWWNGKIWEPAAHVWWVAAIECMSPPVAVPIDRNKVCIFVRTATNVVYGILKEGGWDESGYWFHPIEHPGEGAWISKPAAVLSKYGLVELFCLRSDHELYHRTYSPLKDAWDPPDQWTSLGGDFASAPMAVTSRTGQVYVFCKGYDEEIYYMELASKNWTSLGYAG